jgi:hypothetical protein
MKFILNPWREIRHLREDNARLMRAIADPFLTGMEIEGDTLELRMQGIGLKIMAGMFMKMFENYPEAKNYIEMNLDSPHGPILVTVVKPGGKTPNQLRCEAEEKLAKFVAKYNLDLCD